MTVLKALKDLQVFLEENVCPQFSLRSENVEKEEFVAPKVSIFSLPHKNFSPEGWQVPFILVGLDTAVDDAEEHELSVRVSFGVYSGGLYGEGLPDNSGYIELLNLIEFTKNSISEKRLIGDSSIALKPFEYGVYTNEIVYPYWYGFLTFKLSVPMSEMMLG